MHGEEKRAVEDGGEEGFRTGDQHARVCEPLGPVGKCDKTP